MDREYVQPKQYSTFGSSFYGPRRELLWYTGSRGRNYRPCRGERGGDGLVFLVCNWFVYHCCGRRFWHFLQKTEGTADDKAPSGRSEQHSAGGNGSAQK